ncbi:MAG: EamA family transporter [Betaproteobacteria bacterium]|nr:EamA family transporter [Betaproteobacteria bacterium]
MAIALALLSAVCFGVALVTGRVGLRTLDARSGAAISIPTAAAMFAVAAPFTLDLSAFHVEAAIWFAVIGLFFPAVVTLLTFRSNEQLGPTVTGAVSGTAPLFALLAAGWFLGETIPLEAAVAAVGVVAGIVLLSSKRGAGAPRAAGWLLALPLSGAAVRGFAQAGAKAALVLWPQPVAATLIGYFVSSVIVVGTNRFARRDRPHASGTSVAWFAATGALNGGALVLLYTALTLAPVSLVAPIVATYPLVTTLVSAAVLRDEVLTARVMAGAAITIAAIVYLVAYGTSS